MFAKNLIQLSSGEVLTVNTYKMYWPNDGYKVNRDSARLNKDDFIRAVSEGDDFYKRAYGKVPTGFVVEVIFFHRSRSCHTKVYGASIKSHLDKWDRKKGLKVAYSDLMKSSSLSNLTKAERRKIAEIVGLCNQ